MSSQCWQLAVNLIDSKMLNLTRLGKVKTSVFGQRKDESWEIFRYDEHKALLKESISLSTNKKSYLMNLAL